ncbi:MAG: hypothetical protein H0U76_03180 [Ktedonobacteraceae bacterium]|nr:hypothetical protein [Ktedonobacteraceae bacterium]
MKTKTLAPHSTVVRLEMVVIAFFALAALSALVVYIVDPSIYARTLLLRVSPADHYPVPVTLFLVGLLTGIALLIYGVVHHWRWVFWLTLVAFSSSVIQVPMMLLRVADVLPNADPLWYNLFRMGVAIVELGIGVWMIRIYRHEGIWALRKKRESITL